MGKLDRMMALDAANVAESVGSHHNPALALMGRSSAPAADPAAARLQGVTRSRDAAVIPLDRIVPDPDQPRREFDPEALGRLAESMKARGQLQPIRVRWDEGRGAYVIVVGERRWRAAQIAGMPGLACVVMEGAVGEAELLMIQLVENALREDLKPIEQAKAYKDLMDRNGWSGRRVAAELAIDQSMVVQALALLELPAAVRDRVEEGAITASAAYEVAKLDDPVEQAALAERIVSTGMSRAETREAVKRATTRNPKGRGAAGKARKVTDRVIRTTAGPRITVEFKRGLTPELLHAAAAELLAIATAELEGDRQDAA